MDLNELLHAHQVAVMHASASGDDRGRDNHFAKVAEYADRIRQLREVRRMTDDKKQKNGPETIIYGTYAGDTVGPPAPRPVESWEDEGGALDPPEIVLPEGIEMKTVREYRVGPYVYQDLNLAMAEHMRRLSVATADE